MSQEDIVAASSSNPAFRGFDREIAAQAASTQYLEQMYQRPSYGGQGGSAGQPGYPGQAAYQGHTGYPAQPGYGAPQPSMAAAPTQVLTLDDVVTKTAAVLGLAVVTGAITAYFRAYELMIPALIVGLVLAMIVIFKRSTNPLLILSYAAAEGVLLGGLTGWFNEIYPGIGMQAVVGTLGVFVGMLFVYKTGAIRVTPKFTKILIGAMVGALALMVVNLLGHWLGFNTGLRDGGTFAIIFSVVCIVIAALSFLLDFDQIDRALKAGAPAKYSWYFAFGLMVTLVWLYIEILRLLSYMRN